MRINQARNARIAAKGQCSFTTNSWDLQRDRVFTPGTTPVTHPCSGNGTVCVGACCKAHAHLMRHTSQSPNKRWWWQSGTHAVQCHGKFPPTFLKALKHSRIKFFIRMRSFELYAAGVYIHMYVCNILYYISVWKYTFHIKIYIHMYI